jgi:hexosaminidase
MPGFYVPGCSDGGYPCSQYATLEEAQAACSIDYLCGGVTSQDTGLPPWETRRGPKAVASAQGEQSYVISNDCHGDGGQCWVLPPSFAVIAAEGSFVDDVLSAAMARYTAIINTAVAQTTLFPSQGEVLPGGNLSVTVLGSTAVPLAFGVDESYTLSVSAAGASLRAATVWGALRGLETASQLARHSWTTTASGAINASYNALCSVEVVDAPRFPYRGLMIDTSRHFMPVAVVKQIMELMAYLKMNALRMHLIDTQSWSYYAPDLPQASNTSAFSPLHVYYPGDLKELVAFGRARGIIVYPEVDFPSHSQVLLASVPELGCLSPGPNPYRIYIDPQFPDLWPTMDKVFRGLNDIFPPEYPFHGGGDEVDRNEWALCPSVVAWGLAQNITTGLNNAITDWWYTSFYAFLRAPPYNRVVMFWEDATDAVNASTWVDADTSLILEQWNGNPGTWRSDTCSVLATNARVLVSGPFHDVIGSPPSFNSNPEQNYADIFNLTCTVTPRIAQQLVGPELMCVSRA